MLHVVSCAQEGIGLSASGNPVRLELPNKQQHLAPTFPVVDVPLTRWGESAAVVLWLCQWNRFSLME